MVRQVNWRGLAVLVGEGHLADGPDTGLDGVALGHVNGPEHAHFEIEQSDFASVLFLVWFGRRPALMPAWPFCTHTARLNRRRRQDGACFGRCRWRSPSAWLERAALMRPDFSH